MNNNINLTYTVNEKHKEIIVEEPCIYIENIGINIIIKGIYINNMKKLLLKYLYKYYSSNYKQINDLTTDDSLKPNDKNHKKYEQIKNKNLVTATFSMQDEYNNDYSFMQSGNINNTNNSSNDNNNNNNNNIYDHSLPSQEESEHNKIRNGCSNINDNNYDSYNYNNSIKHYSVIDYGTKIGTNMNDSMVIPTNAVVTTPPVAPPTTNATNYNSNINSTNNNNKVNYLEHLINEPTAKEKKIKQETTNILSIIEAPTVIEEMRIKKFQKQTDSVKIICPHLTKKVCMKHSKTCNKVHFKKIISEHTDISLGDCSYLDTCRHIETCKFVHYAVDKDDQQQKKKKKKTNIVSFSNNSNSNVYAPQWIRCDLRNFDLSIFNEYVSVVMADPPWDIHMDLPYGTMTDNEMKLLPVQLIQDEGMIFLWVTGRAMELARECLQIWGYKRVEEILWIKTNHLQRIIRTGRTGHWLNHSKEHCLVGIKGNPVINRNIDCNVIVSEVRETSRKPDEIYSLIERLCPQNLKIELFGRPHNIRNNWITLGNQLNGVVLHHPQIKQRYNKILK
uniref:mRNA (N6-adenosine)-methyltransferase n=1 Tax=Piliocolobus tephrosceles TaxID=591936 RepID=A0A8C9HEF2_9PRIM